MVERTKHELITEFKGKVDEVTIEKNEDFDGEQYHIAMTPEDVEIEGKTGQLHTWLRIPPKATEESVPEGCAIDKYLIELESIEPKLSEKKTVSEALMWMKGKKFQFKARKLGKSYKGHEAREYFVPVQMMK